MITLHVTLIIVIFGVAAVLKHRLDQCRKECSSYDHFFKVAEASMNDPKSI